ncbi:hypothetical protein QQF73_07790 [Marinobacter sp. M216]|uniref:Lipase helper protein n=1 Tax=Marinobacter albus TaxID=3030833 RepID=A0ABT7HAX1_9GAMM|nr:hypothetical protein [Marinobacter sp. M216]MDK9557521.1 hypothetical protein [Marinobacter sp. M216]
MKPTKVQGLALTSLVLGIAAFAWYATSAGTPTPDASPAKPESQPVIADAPEPAPEMPVDADNTELEQVHDQLLATYGSHLDQPKSQIRMLEEMIRYLSTIDPEHWHENLLALLQTWFPDRHGALRERLTALLAYQSFMEQERYALRAMAPGERRDFIWAKRRELFGEDAELIWQAELQNQALSQSLQSIESVEGTPLNKARAYTDAIEQTYGEQANRVLENRRQELTDRFLSLPSVQSSLHQQPVSERYATLRGIRSELGMDEEALDRWGNLDRTRDERWSKGDRYQAKREAILDKYDQGPERQEALDQLTEDVFGKDMAEVIRSEEAAGYYRFKEERVFGQN